jgi:hypothetical protein
MSVGTPSWEPTLHVGSIGEDVKRKISHNSVEILAVATPKYSAGV